MNEEEYPVDTSEYWVLTSHAPLFDGYLKVPKNLRAIAIYSKYAFKYPRLIIWTKLPRFSLASGENGITLWFGLENGSNAGNGLVAFRLVKTSTVDNVLYASVRKMGISCVFTNLEVHMPSDFDTSRYAYEVIVTKNLAMFKIKGKPVCFAVFVQDENLVKVLYNNVKPWCIAFAQHVASRLTTLIECYVTRNVETEDKIVPLSPYSFRVSEGPEIESLTLPLYIENSDTKLAGHSTSSTVTSHPVPTKGYKNKTFYFTADTDGTVKIEVYSPNGTWREYDSVSYTANKLMIYNMTNDALLARLIYEPATTPATINDAWVDLS